MKVPLLDLVAQHETIQADVQQAVNDVIRRQGFIMGPENQTLEARIAELSGTRYGIGCASGTDALLLPLKCLDLQPGDEVITPSFTFFATAGAIHNAGGTPVFVDIEVDTFCVDPQSVAAAITDRTRAIVVVHLYGQMAAMEALLPLARQHGLVLIEDAAQSIGARRRIDGEWHAAGSLGKVGTLSFFPTKNLGAWGDGGMIVTNDEALATRLRAMRIHGGAREYFHDEVGTNSRLDSLQAAVLLAKLPHLPGWSAARRSHARHYTDAFAESPGVVPPPTDEANEHIFHQYTIRAGRRDALREHLNESGIGNKIYYPLALHLQPCFADLGYQRGSLPVTEAAMDEVISVPIYPEMSNAQLDRVVEVIQGFYA
ncbi:MAG: DegT/DnrJ/EryC1/StrS family aminotransferase [Gemmatimonadales bacterium]